MAHPHFYFFQQELFFFCLKKEYPKLDISRSNTNPAFLINNNNEIQNFLVSYNAVNIEEWMPNATDNDNDNGKINASYTLLSLLCVEIWCRAYINN